MPLPAGTKLGPYDIEEILLAPNGYVFPLDWSSDGSVLLYYVDDGTELHAELRVMRMKGERTSRLLLKAPLYTSDGVLRWIAYSTRESGTQRIFATPYPGPGPRIRISPGYGGNPIWQKDGRAVLYEEDNFTVRVTEVTEHDPELLVGKTREIPQVI